MKLNGKILLLAGVAIALVVGFVVLRPWIYGSGPGTSETLTDEIAVVTQPAKLTTLKEAVTAMGSVTPQAAADFMVIAPEPGTVAELPKQEGEIVQAGDVVARIDVASIASELATRQLEVSEATGRMETAKAEATRIVGLYDKGLAARAQADAARAALTAAEGALNQARSRLELAKAAESTTIIRARFTGVVAKRWHNVGDAVSAQDTDPILRVVDMNRLQISAPFATADAARILPGQLAEVQTEAGPMSATVALKLGVPTAATPTVDVRLNFLVPTPLPLDAPLQISIVVNERKDVLVVPAEAIQRIDTQTFVWMVDANSQAIKREVRIGYIANGQAEVVSGLKAGEQVIAAGIAELTEGTRVLISR